MNLSNIWLHPKTSIVGVLVALLSVTGILLQHGITFGHVGAGTTVGLISSLCTLLLGLFAKDSTNALRGLTLIMLLPLTLMLSGCPSAQRQQAAQAAENASIIVRGFEDGEIIAHQQGLIPDADHLFIQKEMITVAGVGKAADSCIASTTTNAGIVACANTAVAEIDQINTDGGLYLKSDKAKTDFQLAMVGVRTALQVIATIFGAK
jgi:hypothetical protein